MRTTTKIAAAAVMAVALTGCGEDDTALMEQCGKIITIGLSFHSARADGLTQEDANNVLREEQAYRLGWVVKSVFSVPADTSEFMVRGGLMGECRQRLTSN